MSAITSWQHERTEVNLVLQSGIFDKAPRLGKFFQYICDRYFEGQADQLKEYCIAIEALGRSVDFDPKKDSIVRVEAHRLRKRLDQYYQGPGANRSLQIIIPHGQYRPVFITKEIASDDKATAGPSEQPAQFATEVLETPALEPAPTAGHVGSHLRWVVPVIILVLAAAGVLLTVRERRNDAAKARKADEVWTGTVTEPVSSEFRMLAGYHGSPFTDRQGHTWQADAYYKGGISSPISADRFIEAQPDPHLIKAQRTGQFRYDIPLRQGTHELHLYFAETEFGVGNPQGGGESSRLFQVSINGEVQLTQIDPLAFAGGPNRLYEAIIKDITPGSDGKLHLVFEPLVQPAFLNALEILPSPLGRIHPVRVVMQPNPVTDSDGRLWAADEYFCGGNVVFRQRLIFSPAEKVLYQGERYGNFAYRIPLARGKYKLTLHFAETWFGTPESGYSPTSGRVFDVYANGVALLRNYSVADDAGGPNRSVEKEFDQLEPNAQGVLLLEFVPVRNYAEVNAIEVVEAE